jgi:hypothetical protein
MNQTGERKGIAGPRDDKVDRTFLASHLYCVQPSQSKLMRKFYE